MRPPEIIILSRPTFEVKNFLTFLVGLGSNWRRTPSANPAEEVVEVAGRICYLSFGERQSPRDNRDYITNLIIQGHESVLEHVNWTFLISGVSRAFTHQLVRHRPGFAYSQLSQQYHDESEATFLEPAHLENVPKALDLWRKTVEGNKSAYKEILSALSEEQDRANSSMPKEVRRAIQSAARSVLPNATETKIVVTANARSLRHFLSVRGAILGDEEMRLVSAGLLRILADEAPSLFSDFRMANHDDGMPIVRQINQI